MLALNRSGKIAEYVCFFVLLMVVSVSVSSDTALINNLPVQIRPAGEYVSFEFSKPIDTRTTINGRDTLVVEYKGQTILALTIKGSVTNKYRFTAYINEEASKTPKFRLIVKKIGSILAMHFASKLDRKACDSVKLKLGASTTRIALPNCSTIVIAKALGTYGLTQRDLYIASILVDKKLLEQADAVYEQQLQQLPRPSITNNMRVLHLQHFNETTNMLTYARPISFSNSKPNNMLVIADRNSVLYLILLKEGKLHYYKPKAKLTVESVDVSNPAQQFEELDRLYLEAQQLRPYAAGTDAPSRYALSSGLLTASDNAALLIKQGSPRIELIVLPKPSLQTKLLTLAAQQPSFSKLPEQFASCTPQQRGQQAFASYGLTRLLFNWNFSSIDKLACVNAPNAEHTGYFCDATQLAITLMKNASLYERVLKAAASNPPRDIQKLLYDYKQQQTTMPVSKSYRIYKEQLMMPTEEILNPWDWGPGGDGSIFFINRKSPETIYFLEAPKKDPDCEVDWWLYWGYLKSVVRYESVVQVFADDKPITQNIRECYYLPSEQPVWKYLVTVENTVIFPHIERYHLMNLTARNRKFLLQERDMDLTDDEGNHWVVAYATENYTPLGGPDEWLRIFRESERGNDMMATIEDLTWEDMHENSKIIVGVINLPSYTSEFPFEQYIKNNATLWRPQELGVDLGSDYDYNTQLAYFDAVADSSTLMYAANLINDAFTDDFKQDFTEYYASRGLQQLIDSTEQAVGSAETLRLDAYTVTPASYDSGIYSASVEGTLQLSDPSKPQTSITINNLQLNLEKLKSLRQIDAELGTNYSKNPLLSIPFDGWVGLTAAGKLDRQGYGVAPSTAGEPIYLNDARGDEESYYIAEGTGGKVTLTAKYDNTYAAAKDASLLKVKLQGNNAELTFSPSVPAWLELTIETPATLYYALLDQTRQLLPYEHYGAVESMLSWLDVPAATTLVADTLQRTTDAGCEGAVQATAAKLALSGASNVWATLLYKPLKQQFALTCTDKPAQIQALYINPSNDSIMQAQASLQANTWLGSEQPVLNIQEPDRLSLQEIMAKTYNCVLNEEQHQSAIVIKWNPERFWE
jgi:hypothetical protein